MKQRTPAYGPAKVDPRDRAAIVDALYRFGAGQDLRDRVLFESAFSEQASLDLTGPALRLGVVLPILRGRKLIADAVMASANRLNTTHVVANPRLLGYDGRDARLFALVEATNLPQGDHSRRLTLMNIYMAELSKPEGYWAIDSLVIENAWMTGDPEVLFPRPTIWRITSSR